MEVLEHPSRLTARDGMSTRRDEACTLLFYEDVGGPDHGPEAHGRRRRHELVRVQVEQVFCITEKDLLGLLACGDVI